MQPEKNKASIPTTVVFTVAYAQTDVISEVDIDPVVFTSYDEAVDCVWSYTKGRIIHACPDAFIEEFHEDFADWLEEIEKDDEPCTEYLEAFIKDLSIDQKIRMMDWQFEFEEESNMISKYSITKHEIPTAP